MLNELLNKQTADMVSRIVGTFFLFVVASLVSNRTLDILFEGLKSKSRLSSYHKRITTLKGLMQNAVSLIFFFVMIAMIVRELGFDIIPLLTAAGIAGLAFSFGAQTLVKDLIAGFFIILENQYNVGDTVKIGNFKGKVRAIHLRTTVLSDKHDSIIYIPNSEIKSVVIYKHTS